MYSEFQEKLLQHELSAKRKIIDLLSSNVSVCKQELKHISIINFHALNLFISKNILKFGSWTNSTHNRKLQELGGRLQLTSCNPDNVIFNFSKRLLTTREKFILSFELDFGLPVYKPSFYKYFLSLEKLVHICRSALSPLGISY